MKWLLAYVLLNHWFVFSQTERILVLAPVCSKSHKISFMPIVEALAEKGHQVTVVTPFSPENQKPNVKEIVLKKNALMEIDTDWFEIQKQNILKVFTWTITVFRTTMKDGYDILMSNEEFQEVLRSRDVDLVIVDAILNDFVLPIIDHINVPFIFYCPASGVPWVMDMLNVPQEYASVPVGMGDYGSQMTFMQRMGNFLSTELFFLVRKAFWLNMLKDVTNKDFPNSRSISEIERDSQLCIINSHPATAWARPLPQNVIPIPALHTRPPKSLPQALRTLADEADQGFIVFTLGSAIPVSSMPEKMVKIFIQVFSRIPQQVFWKWERSSVLMEKLPANVKILEWLPQQDLLGHHNARLFISHGGLIGIQETVYHGVPLLGLPFGNDQRGNLAKASEEGYGLKLGWDDLTEELLYDTIQSLLHNASYKENATRLSKIMQHQLMPGREIGVYWVEHVLRHGGKHLHSVSKNLPFYQHHLLDVWLFLIFTSVTTFFGIFKLTTCLARKIVKFRKEKTQ
ncbi:LOW QUALITY PROTEIN: UDP-glycosyltransferase UGT5 [Daphnia magna]|uniref:LOW QUALITY PROTEIN: UDP-glycosyltransferase UGT5 n=1 Tax=Daphnia magna TaxID=35525 RepID=UPI001E1BC6FC|nr:LOW QUALITY PROTEIN: UDP-glycosyltransferase UGT5 [Daphnia magna]